MKERPILMSAPMVRAILAGTKTQTRRVVKWPFAGQPKADELDNLGDMETLVVRGKYVRCPYGQPGDRLWVRETFAVLDEGGGTKATHYRADAGGDARIDRVAGERWRPSIFMPRAACRLVLEISAVRVERLQDISEADAKAEGCRSADHATGRECILDPAMGSYRLHYRDLWNSLNAKRAPWSSNPWVWVVEFRRAH